MILNEDELAAVQWLISNTKDTVRNVREAYEFNAPAHETTKEIVRHSHTLTQLEERLERNGIN